MYATPLDVYVSLGGIPDHYCESNVVSRLSVLIAATHKGKEDRLIALQEARKWARQSSWYLRATTDDSTDWDSITLCIDGAISAVMYFH